MRRLVLRWAACLGWHLVIWDVLALVWHRRPICQRATRIGHRPVDMEAFALAKMAGSKPVIFIVQIYPDNANDEALMIKPVISHWGRNFCDQI